MPVDPAAEIEVSAFSGGPDFVRGRVKDLRVRWALEEIGLSYRTRLLGSVFDAKPDDYWADQPFGQVPVYKEAGLTLFESGSILIHVGDKDPGLLPREPAARGRAISWMIAALNSIEPPLGTLTVLRVAAQGTAWLPEALAAARPFAERRLAQLSVALGSRAWLEERFTIGDLVMVDVLRTADQDLVQAHANLVAYVARGTSRPAFAAAMAAQIADFLEGAERAGANRG